MTQKKQGRKKGLIWLHFIEGPLLNSSHYEATCKYCSIKMGGLSANMLKHLKDECTSVSEEIRSTLYDLNNTSTKANKIKKNKNKRSRIEEVNSSNDGNKLIRLCI